MKVISIISVVLLVWLFLPFPKMLFSDDGSLLIVFALFWIPVSFIQLVLLIVPSSRRLFLGTLTKKLQTFCVASLGVYCFIGIYTLIELFVYGV